MWAGRAGRVQAGGARTRAHAHADTHTQTHTRATKHDQLAWWEVVGAADEVHHGTSVDRRHPHLLSKHTNRVGGGGGRGVRLRGGAVFPAGTGAAPSKASKEKSKRARGVWARFRGSGQPPTPPPPPLAHQAAPAEVEPGAIVSDVHAAPVASLPHEELKGAGARGAGGGGGGGVVERGTMQAGGCMSASGRSAAAHTQPAHPPPTHTHLEDVDLQQRHADQHAVGDVAGGVVLLGCVAERQHLGGGRHEVGGCMSGWVCVSGRAGHGRAPTLRGQQVMSRVHQLGQGRRGQGQARARPPPRYSPLTAQLIIPMRQLVKVLRSKCLPRRG